MLPKKHTGCVASHADTQRRLIITWHEENVNYLMILITKQLLSEWHNLLICLLVRCWIWDQSVVHTTYWCFFFSTEGKFHHISLFNVSTCVKDNHLPVVYSASCKLSLWCLKHVDWQEVNSSTHSSDPMRLKTGRPPHLPRVERAEQVQMCWCCWRAGWGLCNSASSEDNILMWEPVCSEKQQNNSQCLHLLFKKEKAVVSLPPN